MTEPTKKELVELILDLHALVISRQKVVSLNDRQAELIEWSYDESDRESDEST